MLFKVDKNKNTGKISFTLCEIYIAEVAELGALGSGLSGHYAVRVQVSFALLCNPCIFQAGILFSLARKMRLE
jgi:hypothetical protein